MSVDQNEALFSKFCEYAGSLGGRNGTLAADSFILAAVNVALSREDETGFDEDCRLRIGEAVFGRLAAPNIGGLVDELTRRVSEHSPDNYDVLYMTVQISKTRTESKSKGRNAVAPEDVLEHMFREPNSYLKTLIGSYGIDKDTEGTPAPATEEAPAKAEAPADAGPADTAVPDAAPQPVREPAEEKAPEEPADRKATAARLTERTKKIHETLSQSIFGQDNAISVFTSGYFRSELVALTDKERRKPRATFLFAGPPGVGKTFLAEKAAEALGLPFCRFDMSEYADKEANLQFCGSDKVYKGAKAGNVTSFVARNKKCVLLFDEVEKSHINVIHLFLQMLDAGRLRDVFTEKEVDFKDTILIFTTNAGKQLYSDPDVSDFSSLSRKVILNALRNDVDPETRVAYFPDAICSRFASGNVVMFNNISAHYLRQIARSEIRRSADNFSKGTGIETEIDENVYSALLFAEGGSADARTVTSRAGTFFNDEIFELFRLLDSEKVNGSIEALEKISMTAELPKDNPEISGMFCPSDKLTAVVIASEETAARCSAAAEDITFVNVRDTDTCRSKLSTGDHAFALIDYSFGVRGHSDYLNIEDIDSEARDIFWFIRENYPELPVHLLLSSGRELKEEERVSLARQGILGSVILGDDPAAFAQAVAAISEKVSQNAAMTRLAKANKLITFETAQQLSEDGKTAYIKLFDFELATAVDAEDTKNILSSVSKPNVRFSEIIGAEDAKRELRYFVDYLRSPRKFIGTGVSAPKGVLLYGPPGTGKTMLAKAMASEAGVTFIAAEGNQFLKKYVGEGPEMVHKLFATARKYAPAILFVDEIDAIARKRTGGSEGSARSSEAVLTSFLTEMDGFVNDTRHPVFVLAATNYGVDADSNMSLDAALLRRFDRRVFIDLPNRDERRQYIIAAMARRPAFGMSDELIENIALRSTGMSLAELASVLELALRTAVREELPAVTDEIFEEAFETFQGGEAKKWNSDTLKRVARHESGHAFLCWESGETPSYVTVVARGDHGGYMQHGDNENKQLYTKDELLARIRTSLGGRAAELVFYGERDGLSTGASGDLVQATNTAKRLICNYGMSETLGLACIDERAAASGPVSLRVSEEINAILTAELKNAVDLISANKAAIEALSDELIVRNHLTGAEIDSILSAHAVQRKKETVCS